MRTNFLHNHPDTEKRLMIDPGHVIVDVTDWAEAKQICANHFDAEQSKKPHVTESELTKGDTYFKTFPNIQGFKIILFPTTNCLRGEANMMLHPSDELMVRRVMMDGQVHKTKEAVIDRDSEIFYGLDLLLNDSEFKNNPYFSVFFDMVQRIKSDLLKL